MFQQIVRERLTGKEQSKILDNKGRQTMEETEKLHVIDYEYFKKALIRIAALAQDKLSG